MVAWSVPQACQYNPQSIYALPMKWQEFFQVVSLLLILFFQLPLSCSYSLVSISAHGVFRENLRHKEGTLSRS